MTRTGFGTAIVGLAVVLFGLVAVYEARYGFEPATPATGWAAPSPAGAIVPEKPQPTLAPPRPVAQSGPAASSGSHIIEVCIEVQQTGASRQSAP